MRANERADEQVAQYFRLGFWLIWPTVWQGESRGVGKREGGRRGGGEDREKWGRWKEEGVGMKGKRNKNEERLKKKKN